MNQKVVIQNFIIEPTGDKYCSHWTTKALIKKGLNLEEYIFLLNINLFWPLLHKSSMVIHT